MKNKVFVIISLITGLFKPVFAQDGIGIGTINVNDDAILEIESTSKGLLIPRMTGGDRSSMTPSSPGLMVYDTSVNAFFYYNGTEWLRLIERPESLPLDMSGLKIINLANGTSSTDAVNKGQLDTKLAKSGGTMSGEIAMNGNKISGLSNGSNANDAVNKNQLDSLSQKKANKEQTNWIDITLANGWTHNTGDGAKAQYMVDEFGIIHLRGSIRATNSTSAIFINDGIPSEYRPPNQNIDRTSFAVASYSTEQGNKAIVATIRGYSNKLDAVISNNDYFTSMILFLDGIQWDTREF